MKQIDEDKTQKYTPPPGSSAVNTFPNKSGKIALQMIEELERTLDQVAEQNPRIAAASDADNTRIDDLRALVQISLAINSSLVLDDVLQIVMQKAVELMQAERGLLMLLDEQGELQVKSAYNLCREEMMEEDFRISGSVTAQVARTGKSVYTSDAMADDRYA
jgi:transcriptional regulator with GAF, ATPase, and Fis domain